MSKNKESVKTTEEKFEEVGEKLATSEQFFEKNQKPILYTVAAIIIIIGVVLAYHYLYKIPRNEKAQAAIFKGEAYFLNGNDSLALFGNNNDYAGFESIISEYKGTKTADLAHAYAGICYSRIGNNEKSLEHLKKFKGGDLLVTPAITGAIGDIYMNLGQPKEAIKQFNKAAKDADNEMLSPLYYKKAGLAHLNAKNYDKAVETFEQIKEKYLNTPEGQEADKYIEEAKLLGGKTNQ
mgnify:CR=1 FL=1